MAGTVSDVLVDEMVRLHMAPLERGATTAQIKIAQAQLLGWMTGLLQAGGLISGALASEGPALHQLLNEDTRS